MVLLGEAHGVHALAGSFDASSAEPPEEFLGFVSDEHASEGDPEEGLRCGGSLRATSSASASGVACTSPAFRRNPVQTTCETDNAA